MVALGATTGGLPFAKNWRQAEKESAPLPVCVEGETLELACGVPASRTAVSSSFASCSKPFPAALTPFEGMSAQECKEKPITSASSA